MCTPARTPTSARTRRGLSDVPLDVFALCLDELDPVDLGRLACVSRAFNDALKTPSNWNRKAAKSLCTDGEPHWVPCAAPMACSGAVYAKLDSPLPARVSSFRHRVWPAAGQHRTRYHCPATRPRPQEEDASKGNAERITVRKKASVLAGRLVAAAVPLAQRAAQCGCEAMTQPQTILE